VTGTPTFFINGRKMGGGAGRFEVLRAVVERELAGTKTGPRLLEVAVGTEETGKP
jgi:hypothetical protein